MDEIRYGVIGTGMMGIEHVLDIAALDGARLVAIADPFEPSRRAAVTASGDPDLAVFAGHRALMAEAEVDAIVIATPNHTHASILEDVFAASDEVHVLVEKPLCTTTEDCARIARGAADRGGLVWVGLEYRYKPAIAALLAAIEAVGRVRMVAIREHRFPFLPKVGDWNRFSRNTGGTLVEKCCHFFDLMNLVIGARPVRVMASGAQDVNHLDEVYDGEVPDVLDNAYVVVDYAGGERAMLDLCMFAEASRHEQELAVTGECGKVEALLTGGILRVGRRHDTVEECVVPALDVPRVGLHEGASFVEHRRFLAAIRSGEGAEVGVAAGLWSVAIGEAAHRSIAEGRPVRLEEIMGPLDTPDHPVWG